MEHKRGYAIFELLVVLLIVSVISIFAISKVSYAFSEIKNEEEKTKTENNNIIKATENYIAKDSAAFQDEVTIIYAKDVAEAGFISTCEKFNTMKIKVTKEETHYKVEII